MPSRAPTRLLPPRRLALAAGAALAALVACVPSPSAELAQAELLLDISDAVAVLRSENASLQDEVDLLTVTVARQDTILRRLAAVNGIPVPAP